MPPESEHRAASGQAKVLLVDDSEDLLELMTVLVQHLCNRPVLAAKSLDEVASFADEVLSCELALLDINLGADRPSGIDVYRWLRAAGFKAPIVFLTGHAKSYPLVIEAESLGDAQVLCKPLVSEDLLNIIRGRDAK